jgi:putative ABC transport system permease protein
VRFADVLKFALGALFQQKVRTLLTTLGVLLGTFVLVGSVSIMQGIRDLSMSWFQRHDQLRKIEVMPGYTTKETDVPESEKRVEGKMDDAKRERLREALIRRYRAEKQQSAPVPLTQERLEAIRNLPHVKDVTPRLQHSARAYLGRDGQSVMTAGLRGDDEKFERRLVAGRGFESNKEQAVIVSEWLLYRWEIRDDDDVRRVVGKTMRLEIAADSGMAPNAMLNLLNVSRKGVTVADEKVLEKLARQLPAAVNKMDLTDDERAALAKLLKAPQAHPTSARIEPITRDFTIVGVVRYPTKEDEEDRWIRWNNDTYSEVILPIDTAEKLTFEVPTADLYGINGATVTVDSEENVEEVDEVIKETGLGTIAFAAIAKRVRLNLLLISLGMAFVAGVALVVAALGITNTMLMTVLERTHEIGVMKAVGARDIHIQLIFLVEGALIGLIGGGIGLLCGWLVSFPVDAFARSFIEKQTKTPFHETLFAFPPWLTLGVMGFAIAVTTLAAVYPARRAARVNPVTALRHE